MEKFSLISAWLEQVQSSDISNRSLSTAKKTKQEDLKALNSLEDFSRYLIYADLITHKYKPE